MTLSFGRYFLDGYFISLDKHSKHTIISDNLKYLNLANQTATGGVLKLIERAWVDVVREAESNSIQAPVSDKAYGTRGAIEPLQDFLDGQHCRPISVERRVTVDEPLQPVSQRDPTINRVVYILPLEKHVYPHG